MVADSIQIEVPGHTPPHQLRLRLATTADIPALLDLTLTALEEGDELYSYNFPYRHDFPDDHRFYWAVRLQALLYIKGMIYFVAEKQHQRGEGSLVEENQEEGVKKVGGGVNVEGERGEWEIVAWTMWGHHSASGREESAPLGTFGDTWGKWVGRMHVKLYQRIWGADILNPKRRDIHREHYKAFMKTCDAIQEKAWVQKYPESIQLAGLNVGKKFQRQGYGTAIVDWGVKTFGGRGVPIGVESTGDAKAFYEKCGFEAFDCVRLRCEEDREGEGLDMFVYTWKG